MHGVSCVSRGMTRARRAKPGTCCGEPMQGLFGLTRPTSDMTCPTASPTVKQQQSTTPAYDNHLDLQQAAGSLSSLHPTLAGSPRGSWPHSPTESQLGTSLAQPWGPEPAVGRGGGVCRVGRALAGSDGKPLPFAPVRDVQGCPRGRSRANNKVATGGTGDDPLSASVKPRPRRHTHAPASPRPAPTLTLRLPAPNDSGSVQWSGSVDLRARSSSIAGERSDSREGSQDAPGTMRRVTVTVLASAPLLPLRPPPPTVLLLPLTSRQRQTVSSRRTITPGISARYFSHSTSHSHSARPPSDPPAPAFTKYTLPRNRKPSPGIDLPATMSATQPHDARDPQDGPRKRLAYIALGSNMGDRIAWIERACNEMDARGITVKRTSSLWETEPMYVLDQDRFVNGACEVGTCLFHPAFPDMHLHHSLACLVSECRRD